MLAGAAGGGSCILKRSLGNYAGGYAAIWTSLRACLAWKSLSSRKVYKISSAISIPTMPAFRLSCCFYLIVLLACQVALAVPGNAPPPAPEEPKIAEASDEGEQAL